VGVSVVHDAKIACAFFVDVAPRAISADGIGADATVMLSKEIGEISQANHAIGLFLVCLFLLHLHVYLSVKVPGMVKLTTFCPPPTMNDLDWGYSLLIDEP
jgi:16S rRNA A1518/A1519 N6-dimethyltransferase RsmA/KsgA/DIM1 with predicted DNA glycosylase/AP lyase activity